MKHSQVVKNIITASLMTVFLSGFTSKDKYVQIEATTTARYSPDFPEDGAKLVVSNAVSTLRTNTVGEILEQKTLPTGHYAVRIKVLNGPDKNMRVWVFKNDKTNNLKFSQNTPSTHSSPTVDVQSTLTQINHYNTPSNPGCFNCSLKPVAGNDIVRDYDPRGMSKSCNSWMNSNGELGSNGQTMFSIMSEPSYARYYTADNSMGDLCPKFNQLSNSEKLMAWTWFWTSLGQEESGCNLKQVHATTYRDKRGVVHVLNPREGYGMWAFERDPHYRLYRGAACADISGAAGQARCAVDMMKKTQLAKGRPAGVNRGSYWGPVHRRSSQLMPHMRRLNLCF